MLTCLPLTLPWEKVSPHDRTHFLLVMATSLVYILRPPPAVVIVPSSEETRPAMLNFAFELSYHLGGLPRPHWSTDQEASPGHPQIVIMSSAAHDLNN